MSFTFPFSHHRRYYLDQVGEEINETLQDTGAVNLSDLGKRFGLYSDFLKEAINARLGKIIRGKLENGVSGTPMGSVACLR